MSSEVTDRDRVLQMANRVHAAAEAAGHPEVAARIEREALQWRRPDTQAVVVGRVKQGKSSLLNALVGREGLLPVDVETATAVRVVLRAAPVGAAPTVTVFRTYDDDADEGAAGGTFVPVGEIGDYVSVGGDAEKRRDVAAVFVDVDAEVLADGLQLVDTPGVHGPDSGHTEVALAAAGVADALVFVTDAAAPLSGDELRFLAAVTERVARVVFVLAKTDAYRSWREVLEADRAVLADRVPELAGGEFVATSARRYARAVTRGQDPGASGIPALAGVLAGLVADRERVRLANVLRVADRSIVGLAQAEADRAAAAADEGETAARIAAELDEVTRAAQASARWRTDLSFRFNLARQDLIAALSERTEELKLRYEQLLDDESRKPAVLAQSVPDDLNAALQATWIESVAELREQVEALAAELEADFGDTVAVRAGDPTSVSEKIDEIVRKRPAVAAPDKRGQRMRTGTGIARAGVSVAAGIVSANPLMLANYLMMGFMSVDGVRSARTRADRSQLQRFVSATISTAQSRISQALTREFTLAQHELDIRLGELIEERKAALTRRKAELTALAKSDRSERERVRREADAAREALEALRRECVVLAGHLASVSGPHPETNQEEAK